MRKTILPSLILLGAQQAMGALTEERSLNTAQHIDPEIDKHLNEYVFNFDYITEYTKTEIEEFWENKEKGPECVTLFKNIYDKYIEVKGIAQDIEDWIDQYNEQCSDKCLPGYVRCLGSYNNKCIKECDCCSQHSLYCCAGTANHPANSYNYAVGDGEYLECYDWCCPEDHTMCQDQCYPDSGLPKGYGPYDDSYGPPYPKTCCDGQDCCDAYETYIYHLTYAEPFCCELNTVLNEADIATGAQPQCCCENEYDICCPDLDQKC